MYRLHAIWALLLISLTCKMQPNDLKSSLILRDTYKKHAEYFFKRHKELCCIVNPTPEQTRAHDACMLGFDFAMHFAKKCFPHGLHYVIAPRRSAL